MFYALNYHMVMPWNRGRPAFIPFGALDELRQLEASGLAAPHILQAAEAAGGIVAGEVLVILADGRTTAVPVSGTIAAS